MNIKITEKCSHPQKILGDLHTASWNVYPLLHNGIITLNRSVQPVACEVVIVAHGHICILYACNKNYTIL